MSLVYTEKPTQGTTLKRARHSIYIGGRSDAKDLDKLRRWGITHILNVTPAKETSIQAGVPNFFERNFVYQRIPIYDIPSSVAILEDQSYVESNIVSFISRGLCHGSVLVHCQHGVSRSTTCVILFLMHLKKNTQTMTMTPTEALTTIRRRRPQAQPIPAFTKFLERYYQNQIQQQQQVHPQAQAQPQPQNKEDRTSALRTLGPSNDRKRIMGPLQPPTVSVSVSLTSTQHDEGMNEADTKTDTSHRPANGPSATFPSLSDKEQAEDEDKRKYKRARTTTIGPSLPPPSSRSS